MHEICGDTLGNEPGGSCAFAYQFQLMAEDFGGVVEDSSNAWACGIGLT